MGYFQIRPTEAFHRLAAYSQNMNVKAAALAAHLVNAAEKRPIHVILDDWTMRAGRA